MEIKTLEVGYLQTNCYIVLDEKTLDCAVIDPGGDSAVILDCLEKHRLCCRAILLTHGHFDHCMGVAGLLAELDAPLYICRRDLEADIGNHGFVLEPPADTRYVDEGDEICAGSLSFQVLACPGHTPGGLTYRIENCLFTGDTLFRLSCGRSDFPASSPKALRLSLARLRELEGDFEVYPGHMDSSTLEYERRFNPYLRDLSLI